MGSDQAMQKHSNWKQSDHPGLNYNFFQTRYAGSWYVDTIHCDSLKTDANISAYWDCLFRRSLIIDMKGVPDSTALQ